MRLFLRNNDKNKNLPKIYSKIKDSFYDENICLSEEKYLEFYNILVRGASSYSVGLSYLSLSQIKHPLSPLQVIHFLVKVFSNYSNQVELAKTLTNNKKFENDTEWQKFISKEKTSVLMAFYKNQYELKNCIDGSKESVGLLDQEHIFKKLKDLNEQLRRESAQKNIGDRFDYYCTLDDAKIYNLFVSPVVGFHGIIFGLLVPVLSPAPAALLANTAIGASLGIVKKHFTHFIKSVYNVYIRNNSFRQINSLQEEVLISAISISQTKKMLGELKKVSLKTGQFNFFFSNTFKYYCKLKSHVDKVLFLDIFIKENEYNKIKNKYQMLYYKTLCYSKKKELIENTLELQLSSLKALNTNAIWTVRNNPKFIKFIEMEFPCSQDFNDNNFFNDKNELYQCIKSIVNGLVKNKASLSVKNNMINLILISLLNKKVKISSLDNFSITEFIKNDIKKDVDSLVKSFGSINQGVLIGVRAAAKMSPSNFYLNDIINKSSTVDMGLFLISSALDGIMYLSENDSFSRKYKYINNWILRITGGVFVSKYAASVVYQITSKWFDLFSNSFLDEIYVNPFSIITDLFSSKVSQMVSKNHQEIWNDIMTDFEKYKEDYRKKEQGCSPFYDYFVKKRPGDPSEVVHNISDFYKKRLLGIVSAIEEINASTEKLIDDLDKYNNKSGLFFKTKKEDILKRYCKIIFKIFTLAKEIENYEQYFKFLNDMNEELNMALKLNFPLVALENKGVFSLIRFMSDSAIRKKITQ